MRYPLGPYNALHNRRVILMYSSATSWLNATQNWVTYQHKTESHINTKHDNDTSQFSKIYRPSESQQTSNEKRGYKCHKHKQKEEKLNTLEVWITAQKDRHTKSRVDLIHSIPFLYEALLIFTGEVSVCQGRNYTSAKRSATSRMWLSRSCSSLPSPASPASGILGV